MHTMSNPVIALELARLRADDARRAARPGLPGRSGQRVRGRRRGRDRD